MKSTAISEQKGMVNTDLIPFAITFLLSVFLRFTNLGGPSLWIDEAFVSWFTNNSWPDLFYALHIDGGNLPAYFVVVKLLTGWIGHTEVGLRLFSAFASSIGVLLAMYLGKLAAGKTGALVAGWFWAVNPMAIWYARDAKPYAFASTLGLGLIICYLLLVKKWDRRLGWLAFGIMVVGLFTHYYFFLVLMALVLFSIVDMGRNRRFFRRWFGMSMIAFVPLAGWLGWYFSQPVPHLGIGWIQQPSLMDILLTLWNLASGYGGELSLPTSVLGLLVLCLCGVGLSKARNTRLGRMALIAGILLPITAVWVLSQRRPIYMDRYFIVLLPFVLLPASSGGEKAWEWLAQKGKVEYRTYLSIACAVVLWGIGLWAGWQVHQTATYSREDWRGLIQQWVAHEPLGSAELWLLDPEGIIPFKYYYPGEIKGTILAEPVCGPQPCWWVLRQPYTATHAFAQGVDSAERPWKPEIPQNCTVLYQWDSPSGLALWQMQCAGTE